MSQMCHKKTLRCDCSMALQSNAPITLGKDYLAFVLAACEGIRQIFGCVRASALGALEFAGASGIFIRIFLEVRTLLEALLQRVSTFKGDGTSPGAFLATVRHVLIFALTVTSVLQLGWIVGDRYVSAGVVN